MAEPVKPPTPPAIPTPALAEAPVAATPGTTPPPPPAVIRPDSKLMKTLARLLTTTFFLCLGLALVALAILLRFHPGLVPSVVQPVFDRFIPRLPYFVMAFGLLFLGQARSMTVREYSQAQKKNRQYPHAWKIPLIATQAFFLQFAGFFYAFMVGVGWVKPIKSLVGLLFLFSLFMAYVLWYVVAHIKNHFPSIAALRVALLLAVPLAAVSLGFWVTFQMLLPSLLIGLFAIAAAFTSLAISAEKPADQRAWWVQAVCLAVAIGLLVPVAFKALPAGSQASLVQLGLTLSVGDGKVDSLCYSQDGKKIAFALKTDDKCFAQIEKVEKVEQKDLTEKEQIIPLKFPAGEDLVRPIFVDGGKALLVDAVKSGERGIWKINPETGATLSYRTGKVEPFADGVPWSEKYGQFLYVSHGGAGYELKTLTLATGRTKLVMKSSTPILTPSWTGSDGEVAYADGSHGIFYVYNPKSREKKPVISGVEWSQGNKFVPEGRVDEVIPAPDGFRYLYLSHKDKNTAIWVVRPDGTHRDKLYETRNTLLHLSWSPDAQKIVFEEKFGRLEFLFFSKPSCVEILDANLGSEQLENLIPRQISNWSPAVSPDGVKIAFAASEGLWYPSFNHGIWVAVLR